MNAYQSVSLLVLSLAMPLAGALAQQPKATVTGSVTDATTRRKLEGVNVRFSDTLSAVTDRRGMFEVRRVAVGTHTLRVTRVGYRPKTLTIPVGADDRTLHVVTTLEPLPVELAPVVIRGDTTSLVAYGRLADFYRRRHMGLGARFITRADIERRNPFRISQMFWTIPGAWFNYDSYGQTFITFRRAASLRGPCPPAVFLDGAYVASWVGLDDLVVPEQVEGIEIYVGDLWMPPEFAGRGCGAIVIWTR